MIGNHSFWAKWSLFGVALPLALGAAACSSSSDDKNAGKEPPPDAGDGGPQGGDPDGGGGGGNALSVDQFCTHVAARARDCNKPDLEQTMAKDCKNSMAVGMPKLRDDVVTSMDQCVQSQDCKTALSSSAIKSCLEKAATSISPTTAASQFCKSFKEAGDKCEADVDETQCVNAYKIFEDGTLAELTNCTKKPCEEVDACIDETRGF